jgi:hypothetical protein
MKGKCNIVEIIKVGSGRFEVLKLKAKLSRGEKRAILKNPAAFIKRWLVKRGHKVRDCIIDPKAFRSIHQRITKNSPAEPFDLDGDLDKWVVVHIETGKFTCMHTVMKLP